MNEQEISANNNLSKLFSEFGVSGEILGRLKTKGIEKMSDIQHLTQEKIQAGTDVMARALTGSGKTFAYLVPMVEKQLIKGPPSTGLARILVISPTRELAVQISDQCAILFGEHEAAFKQLCAQGGIDIQENRQTAVHGVEVVIGSPGRLVDLLNKKWVNMEEIEVIIIDEADRLMEMNFVADVAKIFRRINEARLEKHNRGKSDQVDPRELNELEFRKATANLPRFQLLMFSATFPDWMTRMCGKWMKRDQVTIDIVAKQKSDIPNQIKHYAIEFTQQKKKCFSAFCGGDIETLAISDQFEQMAFLVKTTVETQLTKGMRALVFCQSKVITSAMTVSGHFGRSRDSVPFTGSKKKKRGQSETTEEEEPTAEQQSEQVENHFISTGGIKAAQIHSGVPQRQRDATMQRLRDGEVDILIATDVISRGMDLPLLDLVINTEPPKKVDDQVHRSGRTGRMGKSGTCVTLWEKDQEKKMIEIANSANINFERISWVTPHNIMADYYTK